MSAGDGSEPITPDETLFRRIPASQPDWYNPQRDPPVSPFAFNPTKEDTTGLSLTRRKHTTVEKAGAGRPGKSYFVAFLRAGALDSKGIVVIPKPEDDNRGHAEIPAMTYSTRKSPDVEAAKIALSELVYFVDGPFPRPPGAEPPREPAQPAIATPQQDAEVPATSKGGRGCLLLVLVIVVLIAM